MGKIEIGTIKRISNEVSDLLVEKNTAYGASVEMTYEIFGLDAYLVRMYDKINRLTNLTKNGGSENDEKIEDTLRDLAGYAILATAQLYAEKPTTIIGSDGIKVKCDDGTVYAIPNSVPVESAEF